MPPLKNNAVVTTMTYVDLQKREPEERTIFRVVRREMAMRAGFDTCTLWRLFEEDEWYKNIEFKIYQNLFAVEIVPTVYKEFMAMQGTRYNSVSRREAFLRLIDAHVIYPTRPQRKYGDEQIVDELVENSISMIVTDNVRHFEETGIEVIDSKMVAKILASAL